MMRSVSEIFSSEGVQQMPEAMQPIAPLYQNLYLEAHLGIPFPAHQRARLAWLEERTHRSGEALLALADDAVFKYGLGDSYRGEPPELAEQAEFERMRSAYARCEIAWRLHRKNLSQDETACIPENFGPWARRYTAVVKRRKAELAARTGEPARSIPPWVPIYAQPPKRGETPMTVPEAFAAAGLDWTEADEEPPEQPPEVPMPELPEVPMPTEPPPEFDDEVPF